MYCTSTADDRRRRIARGRSAPRRRTLLRETSQRLNRVTTMLDHPNALASPGLLLRALRLKWFARPKAPA